MKKIPIYLSSALTIAITPFFIVGCNNKTNNQELPNNLTGEVARVNSMNLSLKNNNITAEQISSFISTPLTFLSSELNGWTVNPAFQYKAELTNDSNNNQLKLVIEIVDRTSEGKSEKSKEFIFSYNLVLDTTLQEEINKINLSQIKLKKDRFTQLEIDAIDQTNLKEFLVGYDFNNDLFKYDVVEFVKESTRLKFKFQVSRIQNPLVFKETNQFTTSFQIEPSNPSQSSGIGQELKRLNETFKPQLQKQNITFQELLDINKKNLWDKITNVTMLDTNKFTYKINFVMKTNSSSDKNIQFNLEVNLKGLEKPPYEWEWKNYTNNFVLNYNLIPTQKPSYDIDSQYLKDNLVDPVTNGSQYYFSTPGGGTGQNSINVSNGQGKTSPSTGVPENGKSVKDMIYSEVEKRQLKNTFSLAFQDFSGGVALGTGWILDYKLTEDGSYPTTWYFATNAHVIQNLKIANDTISPERYEVSDDPREWNNTNFVQLRTIKDPKVGVEYWSLWGGPSDINVSADIPTTNLRTVYIGLDYLKTSPSDFATAGKWQGTEEYADFAVMEVKFGSPEEAKRMTQDYVNEPERHFKYKKKSLLKDEVKKDYYSVIGFPSTRGSDPWGKQVNLWTSRGANDENKPLDSNPEKLTNLSNSPYYNTFNGKTGMFDAALGFAFFGMDYRLAYQLKQWYNSWGLIYPVDFGNLGEGSSGSMLMDKEGYTTGIHFAADPSATMGFAQALYCEGFNYQGKFGSYNLEGYDLIEGGFPNQKTSYKGNLKRLYGDNFKTKLFPNGLR